VYCHQVTTQLQLINISISIVRNEELYVLYSSSNIIRVIKSRRIRWAGHVAPMGKVEVHTGFCWRDPRERDHLKDLDVDGRIILKCMFKK